MRISHLLHRKQFILIGISILASLFVISEEIIDCLELIHFRGIEPGIVNILLLILQFLFFTFFTWILLKINVDWQPRQWMNLKQLGFSLLVTALLGVIVWQGITPFIHRANRKIIERYERVFPNLKPDKSPSSPHKKKYFYLFHEPEDAWYNNLFTLCIVIFTLSRIYHLYLRKEEVERNFEKLQSESLQSQLDALHNQINPHFFFNALNSLHALIAEGQNQKSLSYLSNLSNVFRYILQSEKKGLVSLQEELAFLETYRFMLSVKYEEKLQFYIDITPTYTGYLLPVLSILPLVENVIKHNEISARNPMTLSILSTDEPSLVIQNRKQAKLDEVDKVGIGLKNLNNRFLLLIHKEIRIEDTPDYFRVTLPLQTPKTTKQA